MKPQQKKKLPVWLQNVEHFVDLSIPFMLFLLAVLIVLEFAELAEGWHGYLAWLDVFIISFFVIDLCFKYYHTRNVVKFVKLYWIDLIAVFPFYTVFRLYAFATELAIAGEQAQKILHEASLLREAKVAEELRFLRESEQISKFAKEGRFVRLVARSLRILRARWYVTHHHMQKISDRERM